MIKLSIIIVSWNVRDLLRECLDSIIQNAPQCEYEVVVVDNGSSDKSADMVQSDFPRIRLIANHVNRGFAAACNQGIREASGGYTLLLNPDCRVTETSFNALIAFADTHERMGIAGSMIVNSDGSLQKSIRRFPTILSQLLMMFKIHHILPHLQIFRSYFADDFDYTRTQCVDQPMGAAFLIRKSLLDEIGLFDERFFIWYEEVDVCKRAKDAGWEVWYVAESVVMHHAGRSFRQQDIVTKQMNTYASCAKYLWKHFGWKSVIAVILMRFYSGILAMVRSFFWKVIIGVAFFEILSFFGYFSGAVNIFGFLFAVLIAFLFSYKRLEYGLMIMIAELAVGSKGHLFALPIGEHEIGVRMGIFAAVTAAWLCRGAQIGALIRSYFFKWYAAIAAAVLMGVAVGVMRGNGLGAVYSDANAWIFFLAAPIAWSALRQNIQWRKVAEVFLAASAVRIGSVLALFYIMGHKGFGFEIIYAVYRWARTTGLAEITQFDFGVSRIFLQSQIYDVILFCIFAALCVRFLGELSRKMKGYVFLTIGVITSLIVSLSRSFWIACALAILPAAYLIRKYFSSKILIRTILVFAACSIASLALLFVVSRLPFPSTDGGFEFDLLAQRVRDLDTEAAAASRWNLLPVLTDAIRREPLWGYGFGKMVTYYSQDPRVLERNPSGAFTTYAFEWGFLDVLIKLGVIGFAVFLGFLVTLLMKGWQQIAYAGSEAERAVRIGLWCGFVALLITNIFSPYLNHPLGIGFLIAYSLYVEKSIRVA